LSRIVANTLAGQSLLETVRIRSLSISLQIFCRGAPIAASFIPQGAFARWLSYELLWLAGARRYAAFNCGFSPVDADIEGHPDYGPETRQIQLYRELFRVETKNEPDWRDHRILEVGCGAGQGLRHLKDALAPMELVGLDYSAAAVRRARRRGLDARRGSAEALPFPDASFDAIACVDSLNTFPRAFLLEAARVLAPGGQLLVADYRKGSEARATRHLADLAAPAGLRVTRFRNATDGVRRALDEDQSRKTAMISRLPQFLRKSLAETLVLRGSDRYRIWDTGRMTYYLATLQHA
jgi:SAM-dependent methyltransferase